jgi:ribokinase
MTITIFGSLNMDLVVQSPHLPVPGETITGSTFFTAPGGKGANQAVACARLGAPARMVGRVGGDVFADALRQSLSESGVNIEAVKTDPNQPSGVALITVGGEGQNTIVLVPGANGQMDLDDVTLLNNLPAQAILLLQLEIPLPTVLAAARTARAQNATVILDPAPAQPLPAELYTLVSIFTPNETEAEKLTGIPLTTEAAIEQAASQLLNRGVGAVIIKLGARGIFARQAAQPVGTFYPAFTVKAIDTVAAGDAFNGGLAAALAAGHPFPEALRWGLAAAAISTTRPGAQPSMPSFPEVLALLSSSDS